MSVLIGERITKFWLGERYVFERIAAGEWRCIFKDRALVPQEVLSQLGD